MRTVTLDEFQSALRAQGVSSHEHFAFKCPMCGTVQSARDLIAAGAGKDFEQSFDITRGFCGLAGRP